jgi:hypothetical protein
MGWRFVNDILGGTGRNRSTDTRIFKCSALPTEMLRQGSTFITAGLPADELPGIGQLRIKARLR